MGRFLLTIVSVIAGIILGVLSNWLYDTPIVKRMLPKNPSVKALLLVVMVSLPFLVLVALPELIDISSRDSLATPGEEIAEGVEVEEAKDTVIEYARVVSEDPRNVEALNIDGDPIWRHQVDGEVAVFDVFDLNGDGTKELIVGAKAKDGEKNTDAGKVIVINQDQERLAEFNLYDPEKPTIYIGAGSPYYWVSGLKVADLFNTGQPYVVAMGQNAEWFSSRIVILSFREDGLFLDSNYWHPGFPKRLVISDLNNDKIMELIISASNNSIPYETGNPSGVFALRSDRVGGQAPPYHGDAPRGTQLWYYLIQPDSVTVISLGVEDRDEDEFLDVKVGLSDNCFYYINYEGELLTPQIGTGCELESRLIPMD